MAIRLPVGPDPASTAICFTSDEFEIEYRTRPAYFYNFRTAPELGGKQAKLSRFRKQCLEQIQARQSKRPIHELTHLLTVKLL